MATPACGVYRIQNTINGKVYIGSSVHLRRRLTTHITLLGQGKSTSHRLQRAWAKYGAQAFDVCILALVPPEDLLGHEQRWLDHHRSWERDTGYNICRKTHNWAGNRHTEQAKAKIGKAHRGKTVSKETRLLIGEANQGNQHWLGRRHTEESRARISENRAGVRFSPEALERVQEANRKTHTGKVLSAETRAKISKAKQGHKHSPETRRKLREAWTRRKEKASSEAAASE